MDDLAGWSALVVALTTALGAVFAQYNTRADAREAKDAALATKAAVEAAAVDAKNDAQEQKDATAKVHTLVNNKSDRQDAKIVALIAEVQRLQHRDATTPTKEDSPESPVTRSEDGQVTVQQDLKRRADDRTTQPEES